ncbi:MAG: hypothetical protein JOZ82_11530 [Marmoricola sp.]|nr:hypothetical protein [Marmoricola sp.]
MRRLVRVELTRFRSRRAIVLLALAAVLVSVALAILTAYQTRPLTAADRADAAAQADLASRGSVMQDDLAECIKDPPAYLGTNATARECRAALVTDVSSFYPRHALDLSTVLDGHRLTRATGFTLALVLACLMIIVGCTFAGADWASGSVTGQLLFESRRVRLWLAKGIAVVIGSTLVSLVCIGGFWAALWLVAGSRGIDVSSTVGSNVVWHVVRAVLLCAGAALGGFALTMIFRNTVATLALLFVYAVGGEIVIGLLPFQGSGRFSVANNVFGWLAPHSTYFDPSIDCDPSTSCTGVQTMTHLEAGLFLGVLVVLAVAVSLARFRRADV